MTTKEHLKAFHEAAATHHTGMAKSHKKLAAYYSKATMDGHQDVSDEHKTMSDSHTTMAEHHLAMCKSIGDSMDKAIGDRIVPDKVSGIVTHFPNITMVPRSGAPGPRSNEVANVPLEFQKLVAVDNDD